MRDVQLQARGYWMKADMRDMTSSEVCGPVHLECPDARYHSGVGRRGGGGSTIEEVFIDELGLRGGGIRVVERVGGDIE